MAQDLAFALKRYRSIIAGAALIAAAAVVSATPAAAQSSDPATWVGCHPVAGGVSCPPIIKAGIALTAPPVAPPPAAAPNAPPRMPQGGRGPIRVLVITKGHEFEREQFNQMLDSLGDDITYTHVDHPAADLLMNPTAGKNFDVYLFYDLGGPGVRTPRADGTIDRVYPNPSPQLKRDFPALLKAGKGMVFMHHASAAWAHTWPEYSEVIGGACDWYAPITVRGILDPRHGYYQKTKQHITVVDKNSPITKGLGDGFDTTDEAYACAFFEDSVHPLLRTDFTPPDPLVNLNPKRKFSNLSAWYKSSENSPVFYVQIGHDHTPWEQPEYRLLLRNAIKWAASPEALAWAKAHPTKIFK
ncbi:ThuA domain-containing protein [Glacieibacterium sp.]|uniref:ThuA domain-containing protein n=1 Tax=Glacieibacterium sp. TaxID=2860237 RepID=UPI003B002E8F